MTIRQYSAAIVHNAYFFLIVTAITGTHAYAESHIQSSDSAPTTVNNPNKFTDEITVTARKREESLQNVPISISVFSDKAMRDRNINSAYGLSAFPPNFSFSPNLGRRLDL